jgi:exopolysaccharide biosynthesis protein
MKKWLLRFAVAVGLVIYVGASSVLLVFYGPFEHLRSTAVGSILTSRHPQYAEYFLSQEKLQRYQPLSMDVAAKGDTEMLNNYSDITDNSIEVLPVEEKLFTGKLMIVKNPKRLHVEVTQHLNDVGEFVSDMADRTKAAAAINAGGFLDVAGHGTGGIPIGLTITHGQTVVKPTSDPIIGFTKDGALVIGKYTPEEIESLNVTEAVSFGPQLVHNGQGMIASGDGGWGRSARSAIGQRADGAVLLLVVQGRGTGGIGATLKDLEQLMIQHGALIAANLDGGFSAEMWQDGQLVVPPSNPLGERPVATSFVVSKN